VSCSGSSCSTVRAFPTRDLLEADPGRPPPRTCQDILSSAFNEPGIEVESLPALDLPGYGDLSPGSSLLFSSRSGIGFQAHSCSAVLVDFDGAR
ncbi:unnamed protein product, partial [Polarella glacialis]